VPWSPWDPGHRQGRRSRRRVAYPHQDQLRRVGRGDEGTTPGAARVGVSSIRRHRLLEDRRPLDALIAVVLSQMQFSFSKKRTAKEAWDTIAAARIGSNCARKTTLQAIRKEWENLAFKPGEDVDDFALRLNTLQQKMVQFSDDTYDEERAICWTSPRCRSKRR
jgi:hypothetical protein